MLASLAFAFFGSWVGVPVGVTAAAADIVKSGLIELLPNSRQKITYYPSKRDEGIVWDTQQVENNSEDPTVNPAVFQIALTPKTPYHQSEDVYVDVYLTRWGFARALTHEERFISDPQYKIDMLFDQMHKRVESKVKLEDITEVPDDYWESVRDEREKQLADLEKADSPS